jgi:hypothetical protein
MQSTFIASKLFLFSLFLIFNLIASEILLVATVPTKPIGVVKAPTAAPNIISFFISLLVRRSPMIRFLTGVRARDAPAHTTEHPAMMARAPPVAAVRPRPTKNNWGIY